MVDPRSPACLPLPLSETTYAQTWHPLRGDGLFGGVQARPPGAAGLAASHGHGSSSTRPSGCRIIRPYDRLVCPEGNGAARISSTS
jgi:hypothetical protein